MLLVLHQLAHDDCLVVEVVLLYDAHDPIQIFSLLLSQVDHVRVVQARIVLFDKLCLLSVHDVAFKDLFEPLVPVLEFDATCLDLFLLLEPLFVVGDALLDFLFLLDQLFFHYLDFFVC